MSAFRRIGSDPQTSALAEADTLSVAVRYCDRKPIPYRVAAVRVVNRCYVDEPAYAATTTYAVGVIALACG